MLASHFDNDFESFRTLLRVFWQDGTYKHDSIKDWNGFPDIPIKESRILDIKKYTSKMKSLLAFFCWLPVIGDAIAVTLGFFRVNFFKVALWMFIGKIIRYAFWIYFTLWGLSFF